MTVGGRFSFERSGEGRGFMIFSFERFESEGLGSVKVVLSDIVWYEMGSEAMGLSGMRV